MREWKVGQGRGKAKGQTKGESQRRTNVSAKNILGKAIWPSVMVISDSAARPPRFTYYLVISKLLHL